jgi:hypothetical protein
MLPKRLEIIPASMTQSMESPESLFAGVLKLFRQHRPDPDIDQRRMLQSRS